jgi:hypothetical protein
MLITASHSARYQALADDIDAALARGDEIGMDLLKSLMPDLTQAVEEINSALREVDSLLFEGLRDEAVGLHDPELPSLAIRLHMQDKPQWPLAASFFESQGIQPPPPIDFPALTALNSAYAEVEGLRKPLDRLRKLALERAPLPRKIKLLRKLRSHDPSKPVWADQLVAHEQVRTLELSDAVKQAFAARNPEMIAALHAELADPTWSIAVPTRLKRDTEGGAAWAGLRAGVRTLEDLAETIRFEFRSLQDQSDIDVVRLDSLRQTRNAWTAEESRCRDLLFSLPQHPAIAPLAQPESFGPRIEQARSVVMPALDWLATVDHADALEDRFHRTCNELDALMETVPALKGEAAWLSRMEKLESDLRQLCQQMPHMHVAESLPLRIERAVSTVRQRAKRRTRALLASLAVGLAALIAAVGWSARVIGARQARREVIAYVDELIPRARQGELIARPERLIDYASQYHADAQIGSLIDELDSLISLERTRRESFDSLLTEHAALIAETLEAIQERDADPERRLEEWPSACATARQKYHEARLKGGFPDKRRHEGDEARNTDAITEDLPPAAASRLEEEETRLAQQEGKQSLVERRLASGANEEFTTRLQEITDAIPDADEPDAQATATELSERLRSLLDEGRRPRFRDGPPTGRVGSITFELAKPVSLRLDDLTRLSR